MIKNSALETDK